MPSPPLVVALAVQVRLLGVVGGQTYVNVLHARKRTAFSIDQTITNTLGAAIKSAWTTNIAGLSNNSCNLARVGLRDLSSANQNEFLDAGAGVVGTGVANLLPPGTALCVTLKTNQSGKSHRGRVYLAGFNEDQNDNGGGTVAAANTAGVAFISAVNSAMAASNMDLCILSRPSYAYVTTKTWTLPTGTQVDTIGRGTARPGETQLVTVIQSRTALWESQRRRQNGRGGLLPALVAQQDISGFAA